MKRFGYVVLAFLAVTCVGLLAWHFLTRTSYQAKARDVLRDATGPLSGDPTLLERLTEVIEECGDRWVMDKETRVLLADLYAERSMLHANHGRWGSAIADAEEQARLLKALGDMHTYAASKTYRAHLLRNAGRWREATDACKSLIAELGDKVTHHPYGLLFNIMKKDAPEQERDPALIAEYRRKALRLSQNDWREEP